VYFCSSLLLCTWVIYASNQPILGWIEIWMLHKIQFSQRNRTRCSAYWYKQFLKSCP
jgi:hypothetical protein